MAESAPLGFSNAAIGPEETTSAWVPNPMIQLVAPAPPAYYTHQQSPIASLAYGGLISPVQLVAPPPPQPSSPNGASSNARERCSEFILTLIAAIFMLLSVHPQVTTSIWSSIELTTAVQLRFGIFKFCVSDQCSAISPDDTNTCAFVGAAASLSENTLSSYCAQLHSAQVSAIAAAAFFGNILIFQLLIACCFHYCCCTRQIARVTALVIQCAGFGLTVAAWKRGRDAFSEIGGSGLTRGTGDTLCIIAWAALLMGAIQQVSLIKNQR